MLISDFTRYSVLLTEKVGQPHLYHWTKYHNLVRIAEEDCLRAFESSMGKRVGVSFTRQPTAPLITGSVVFVVDQAKLRHSYRLEPRYGDSVRASKVAAANPDEYQPLEPRREAEEFVDRDVQPLSRYLSALVINDVLAQRLKWTPSIRRTPDEWDTKHVNDWIDKHHITVISATTEQMQNPSWWRTI